MHYISKNNRNFHSLSKNEFIFTVRFYLSEFETEIILTEIHTLVLIYSDNN